MGIQIAAQSGYQPEGLNRFLFTLNDLNSGAKTTAGLFRSHPDTEERIENVNRQIASQGLDGGVWLDKRFEKEVPYEIATASTGGPAVDGARGMAGSEAQAGEDTEQESGDEDDDEEAEEGGDRFSLAQLATDPFKMGSEEESAEVSGAGAGRAVGEEGDDVEGGPKNTQLVEVRITAEELAAFQDEGGLRRA